MEPDPAYTEDFYDLLHGMREEIAARHEAIYREIEQRLVAVYREISRIQGQVIREIALQIPSKLNEHS